MTFSDLDEHRAHLTGSCGVSKAFLPVERPRMLPLLCRRCLLCPQGTRSRGEGNEEEAGRSKGIVHTRAEKNTTAPNWYSTVAFDCRFVRTSGPLGLRAACAVL